MDGRQGEERRDRRPLAAGVDVAEADEDLAGCDGCLRERGEPVEGGAQPLFRGEGRIQDARLERSEPRRVQEEPGKHGDRRKQPVGDEGRRPWAEHRRHGHDEPLAEMVDRRVRHLREALPEVRRERAVASGEWRDRRVVTHRRDGVVTALREWPQHRVQLLARVAVEHVAPVEGVLGRVDGTPCVRAPDALLHPCAIRPAPCELAPQLGIDQ